MLSLRAARSAGQRGLCAGGFGPTSAALLSPAPPTETLTAANLSWDRHGHELSAALNTPPAPGRAPASGPQPAFPVLFGFTLGSSNPPPILILSEMSHSDQMTVQAGRDGKGGN